MNLKRFHLIVPAAGLGIRLKKNCPKALVAYNNTPIICQALEPFITYKHIINTLVITAPKGFECRFKNLLSNHPLNPQIITGANTRSESVYLAFKHLNIAAHSEDLILIHDAARIFLSHALIQKLLAACKQYSAVVPGIALSDTIKEVCNTKVIKTIPRENYKAIQTPQAFQATLLETAYKTLKNWHHFSDESQLIEALNHPMHCISGEIQNKKITFPEDLE